ncbi:glutaminase A, partial [Francisella tularensis subsp. holarctica]|nr:glutaminase A [Francisella tularensis subsp. holarctica]
DILDILVESCIINDDPLFNILIDKLNKFCDIDKIDFDTFQEITFENIGIIEKDSNKGFFMPNFKDFKIDSEAIYNETNK